MSKLLSLLREQRPLYLLSNTNEVHYEYLEKNFKVTRHFKEAILSYKIGSVKPQPEIYQEVFNRSGLQPEQCLFVDDLEANIIAAQNLGMQTIHFKGPADLKQRLNSLGFVTERNSHR